MHGMTVAAKAAVRDFYGQAPRLSLWNSCSTGGRQGLMEAYRYPDDYDAISAMAPANPMTRPDDPEPVDGIPGRARAGRRPDPAEAGGPAQGLPRPV
ncbi:MAG: tannase/feruloyl esterase family alpha/beta hydrolase [Caulobacteraceae bacterium]